MDNSQVKFRVWDTQVKKMYLPGTDKTMRDEDSWLVDSIRAVNESLKREDLVWLQYIGHHDKVGKEIYEGDIVVFYYRGKEYVDVVIFTDCGFKLKENESYLSHTYGGVKKIGNMYENPELLEGI